MLLVLRLSLRQLAGSRRLAVILLLAALPVAVAALVHFAAADASAVGVSDAITNTLLISTVLPLVMLVLATSSFGNEVEDGTLQYLLLKPVPRWQIAVPKLLAPLIVGGVPVAISGAAASLLIWEGDGGRAATTAAALAVGAAAYAALFTWAGLAVRNALAVGVVYVFVWEAVLSSMLGGSRFLSVRQYALATVHGLDEERLRDAMVQLTLAQGLVGAAAAVAVFLLLTVRRLGRMDVP